MPTTLHRCLAVLPLCAWIVAAGCHASRATTVAPAQAAAPSNDLGLERRVAELVSERRAQERVRQLVQCGPRMGGTESGNRAAQYVADQFLAAGLEVRVVFDPVLMCHEEGAWRVVAQRGGSSDESRKLESAWPYGFSPTANGRARLSLEAAEHTALLSAGPPHLEQDGPKPSIVLVDGETTLDGAYPRLHALPERADNPFPVFGLSRDDGQMLRTWLASGDSVEISFELSSTIRSAAPRTVLARVLSASAAASGDPAWKTDYFLFCAHGDSDAGGPGADDNASGVATLIAIAEAWNKAIQQKLIERPPFGVRFAVWGSEIHSTRDYLASRVPGEGTPLGVINYDQAGFGSGADQLNVEPDDLPANVELVRTLLAVLNDHAGDKRFPAHWATNKSLGGTDSYVFSENPRLRDGLVPALTLFTSAWDKPAEHPRTPGMPGESWRERSLVSVDYDNYYHSAGDTPANTTDKEPWNMGWCARVGLLGARRFLGRAK